MKGIRCLATAGFAVLLPTLATAQFPSPEPQAPSPVRLTLEEAITRGLAVSHRLAEESIWHLSASAMFPRKMS